MNFALPGEEDSARTGGSLIECEDEGHGLSMFSDAPVFHRLGPNGKSSTKCSGIR
jgi:hypothetical protein